MGDVPTWPEIVQCIQEDDRWDQPRFQVGFQPLLETDDVSAAGTGLQHGYAIVMRTLQGHSQSTLLPGASKDLSPAKPVSLDNVVYSSIEGVCSNIKTEKHRFSLYHYTTKTHFASIDYQGLKAGGDGIKSEDGGATSGNGVLGSGDGVVRSGEGMVGSGRRMVRSGRGMVGSSRGMV